MLPPRLLTAGASGDGDEVNGAGELIGCRSHRGNIVSGGHMHLLVDRDVRHDGEEAGRHHQPLPADAIRERAEKCEEGHAEQERQGHDDIGCFRIHFQNGLEIEQLVELRCVTNHALAGGGVQQGDQYALQIQPPTE